jgi:hypothetical protein
MRLTLCGIAPHVVPLLVAAYATRMETAKRNVYLLAICQAAMMTGQALMLAAAPFIGLALAADKALATLPSDCNSPRRC